MIYACNNLGCNLYIPDELVLFEEGSGLPVCPKCGEYLDEYEEYSKGD